MRRTSFPLSKPTISSVPRTKMIQRCRGEGGGGGKFNNVQRKDMFNSHFKKSKGIGNGNVQETQLSPGTAGPTGNTLGKQSGWQGERSQEGKNSFGNKKRALSFLILQLSRCLGFSKYGYLRKAGFANPSPEGWKI